MEEFADEAETPEEKKFSYIQAYLALTLYLEKEPVGVNPAVLLSRTDKRTPKKDSEMHKIHNNAMATWLRPESENKPSLAELFREQWELNRSAIEMVDLTNRFACLDLIEKVRNSRNTIPEAGV